MGIFNSKCWCGAAKGFCPHANAGLSDTARQKQSGHRMKRSGGAPPKGKGKR
jgi:hypothetical protein